MVFHSSTITMMHGPINIRCKMYYSVSNTHNKNGLSHLHEDSVEL